MKSTFALLLLGLLPLGAQEIKFPESFDKLAARAKEKVNVSLDGSMLQLAGNFLSADKGDEASAKKVAGNLKGLYVRSFTFEKEGEYSDADIAPLRSELSSARGWSRMVDISDSGDHVEVYAKKEGDRFGGMTVIAAEKKELTVVYVDGPIDLKQLGDLVKGKVNVDLSGASKK